MKKLLPVFSLAIATTACYTEFMRNEGLGCMLMLFVIFSIASWVYKKKGE